MDDLLNAQPDGILAEWGHTIFYFGVKPTAVLQLETGSEFILVYSPTPDFGWQAVQYRVIHQNLAYCVINRRDLAPREIEHFKALLKASSKQQ